MLRLKQAMDDCNIKQKAFCTASGWSKTQVCLTLNTGKLPANSAKFASDVVHFACDNPALDEWLKNQGLEVEALLDDLSQPAAPKADPDLERALAEIAGRALLNHHPYSYMVTCLARGANHLLKKLTDLTGEDNPYLKRTKAEVIAMLSIDID